MPLNIPGLLVPFQLLWNPRVVLPHVILTGQTEIIEPLR
jgi:phosphatidylglycerophosphatase GEP4